MFCSLGAKYFLFEQIPFEKALRSREANWKSQKVFHFVIAENIAVCMLRPSERVFRNTVCIGIFLVYQQLNIC